MTRPKAPDGVKTLCRSQSHLGWDCSLPPSLEVAPGDEVSFEITDASGGQLHETSTATDVERMDSARVNPVTGPVFVHGAEPGDVLIVEFLDFVLSSWGWTAIIPNFGLLTDEFPDAYLHHSRYSATTIEFTPEVALPTRPFAGTVGVAPAAPGLHSVIPPRRVGGNMDCRDVIRGARLHLPVEVPGALFSIGDTHAAQGDGEVCGTAIETPMSVRVRFGLHKQHAQRFPRIEVPRAPPGPDDRGSFVTSGIGADLMQACRDAIREMIDHLGGEYGLTPELAYCLCSVAVNLRISEVVDAPNWMVTAGLPKGIFR